MESYRFQNKTIQVSLNKDTVYKQSISKHKAIYNLGGTIHSILPIHPKRIGQSVSWLPGTGSSVVKNDQCPNKTNKN